MADLEQPFSGPYAIKNLSNVEAQAALGFSGTRRCVQKQRFDITQNTWITVLDEAGAGTLETFWLALDILSGNGVAYNGKIRITFDGAANPQVGGADGIALKQFFGEATGSVRFLSKNISVNKSSGSGFSGDTAISMPFGNGIKIEVYLTSNGPAWFWMMAEIGALERGIGPLLNYRLHADFVDTTLAALAEGNLLNAASAAYLLGVNMQFIPETGGSNFYYLEGDFKGYANGEVTPSYRASGAEDFFLGSYYFDTGLFARDVSGLLIKNPTDGYLGAYRFFPIGNLPGSSSSYRFTWTNGDSDYPGFATTYNTRILAVVYYYKPAA